jgi:translocator protein
MIKLIPATAALTSQLADRVSAAGTTLATSARTFIQPDRYRWWHAAAFEVAMQLIQAPMVGNTAIYNSSRQAPFAPPNWVFGPAWLINNVSVLWGNLRLLNLPAETPHRRTLLWLQGASWGIFTTFSYVYFGLESPTLAFAWTFSMYALTIASIVLSAKIDPKIALSFATLFLWLSLATPVAAYQMIYNPDAFLGTPAWR